MEFGEAFEESEFEVMTWFVRVEDFEQAVSGIVELEQFEKFKIGVGTSGMISFPNSPLPHVVSSFLSLAASVGNIKVSGITSFVAGINFTTRSLGIFSIMN